MAIFSFEASFLSNSQVQADEAKGNRTCRQPQNDTPSHHTPCSAASHHVRLPASPSVAGGGLKNGHRLLNAASERWRIIASTERSVSYRRCCDSPNQRTEIDIVSVRDQCKEFGGGRGGRGVSFCALEWGWRTVREKDVRVHPPRTSPDPVDQAAVRPRLSRLLASFLAAEARPGRAKGSSRTRRAWRTRSGSS